MTNFTAAVLAPFSGWAYPGQEMPVLSRGGRSLFLVAAVLLVVPLGEVPGWGISISTPLFCLVALDLLPSSSPVRWNRLGVWIALAASCWFGQFLSIAGNVLTGQIATVTVHDALRVLRHGFWISVFVVALAVVSHLDLDRPLAAALGAAVVALALLRLTEGVLGAGWGPQRRLLIPSNQYGWLFSTFTPFAVAWLGFARGWRRAAAVAGLSAVVLAVALNGSRSSWVSLAVSMVVFLIATAVARRGAWSVAVLLMMLVGTPLAATLLAPSAAGDSMRERLATFSQLDRDKPWAVRQLMWRKGTRLFQEHPLFGVGAGRFRSQQVELDLPPLLREVRRARYLHRSAHNSYVALLAESGLAGAVPYAALLLTLTVLGSRTAWRRARRGDLAAVAFYASFVAMSLHLVTVSGLANTATWFVYGLLAAMIQRERLLKNSAAPPEAS